MWLGIDAAWWAQLWSGVIGSFIAAVIGGLVALIVVRLTNGHQSKVASHGRVLAAIGDFNAAISQMPRRYHDGREAIQQLVIQADAASNRITMDMDDFPLAEELTLWGVDLGVLAVLAADLQKQGYIAKSDEAWRLLRSAIGTVVGTTQQWSRTSAKDRKHWAAKLQALREKVAVERDGLGV